MDADLLSLRDSMVAPIPPPVLDAARRRVLASGGRWIVDALAALDPGWTFEHAAGILAADPASLEPLLRAARGARPAGLDPLLDEAKRRLTSPGGAGGLVRSLAALDPAWVEENVVAIVEADRDALGPSLLALEAAGRSPLEAGFRLARAGTISKGWSWELGLDYAFREEGLLKSIEREIARAAKAPRVKGPAGKDPSSAFLKAAAGKEAPAKVTSLYLSDASSLRSFEPLADLFPNLTSLSAFRLSSSLDLAPLAKHPKLSDFSVSWGSVDLSGLAGSKITTLSIGARATAKGLEAIGTMGSLENLHFHGKGLEKVRAFPPRLRSLSVNGLVTKDLKMLSRLPGLTSLSLGDARSLRTLQPIAKLTRLESLSFRQSGVTTLAPLAALTRMKDLSIGQNKRLSDLHGVEKMKDLEELDANFCPIASLEPLAGKKKLQRLLVRKSRIESLEPIADCAALTTIYAEKTRLRSLAGVERLSKLELLWFWDTKVTDLSPLARLSSLKRLDLSGLKKITDFSVLPKLRALESLDLFRTSFGEPELLLKLPKLAKCRVAGTKLKPSDPVVKKISSALRHRGGVLSFDSSSRWG